MCGIAGAAFVPDAAAAVEAMKASLCHRGPDDEGNFAADGGRVALGHRRLSILDLSTAGRQPFGHGGGQFQIVYNGEIYNFREIRAELSALGHGFRTETDTEVLLAAYVEWGPDCIRRLRGMFAFAIWDAAKRELFLARDRLGIKPIYYTRTSGGGIAFSSEVTALMRSGLVSASADPVALWEYLQAGAIRQPRTILEGVRALQPGHWLRARANSCDIVRWWDLEEETRSLREELRTISYDEAVVRTRALIEEATRYHLISDVPVGAFLSGGIDSTSVVALMSTLRCEPVQTFSIGFETGLEHLSELTWARLAADRFGTDHTEVIITARDAAEAFPAIVEALDQPSHDGANTFFVSRAAADSVKVSLSGLGGDEIFAGYPHFRRYDRARRWTPGGLGRLGRPLRRVARWLPGRVRNELEMLAADRKHRLAGFRTMLGDSARHAAAAQPLRDSAVRREQPREQEVSRGLDAVQEVSYAEVNGYLRDTLLRDADAMSMAHSLEVRPVLLDHPLVEFGFALPGEAKLRAGRGKAVLVDAVRDMLPADLVNRQKMGFELPLTGWIQSTLKSRTTELFSSDRARRIFSDEYRTTVNAALEGKQRAPAGLWANLVLLAYLELHGLEHP